MLVFLKGCGNMGRRLPISHHPRKLWKSTLPLFINFQRLGNKHFESVQIFRICFLFTKVTQDSAVSLFLTYICFILKKILYVLRLFSKYLCEIWRNIDKNYKIHMFNTFKNTYSMMYISIILDICFIKNNN